MQCHEFVLQAEQWMEGESSATAKSHIDACANCRALVADLHAIRNAAGELPQPEPPERMWVSLRNQLAAEGMIKEGVREEADRQLVTERPRFAFFPSLRPAMATAFLTVVLVIAGLVAYRSLNTINTSTGTNIAGTSSEIMPAGFIAADGDLAKLHEHNPAVLDSYKQNLQIVDNFIALCEKTVKDEPRNEQAREYLYNAYQQKAELLAQISERGAMGD